MEFKKLLKPRVIQEWTALLKEKGIKGFVKEKGWKIVAIVVVFYLVRDSILYLLLPFLIAQGLVCR